MRVLQHQNNHRRTRGSALVQVLKTTAEVMGEFRRNRMLALVPLGVLVFLTAVLLYFVNLVSPIAPFVYSLF